MLTTAGDKGLQIEAPKRHSSHGGVAGAAVSRTTVRQMFDRTALMYVLTGLLSAAILAYALLHL